ncbi:MAG TPA: hypothetical protein VNJ02_08070 [Vicinamibacterales bacterium]|nr:hypothetical protein [Vicinamibacterales bacterium]
MRRATVATTSEPTAPRVDRGVLADVLDGLRAEVAALTARVAGLEARVGPPADAGDDARFLTAIAESTLRHYTFSARELVNHATVDPELRAALGGVTSAKRVGKRLHRLAGHLVGGYRLCRVDRDLNGTIWIVEQVGDLHTNS